MAVYRFFELPWSVGTDHALILTGCSHRRKGAGVAPEIVQGALCAWDDFIYSAEEGQFDPGDFLVLFTDGVTEAQGPDKVQFSNARIVAYLQECDMHADMETITKGLHGAVQDFMGGADRFDDIAIIALRYQGPANQM